MKVFLSTAAQFPFLGWISNPLATVDSSVKGTNIRDCLQRTLHWIQMLIFSQNLAYLCMKNHNYYKETLLAKTPNFSYLV